MKAKKKKSPREGNVTRTVLDELRRRGPEVWFRKNHGGPFGTTGVPDIEVIFRPIPVSLEQAGRDYARLARDVVGTFARPEDLKNPTPPIVAFIEMKRPGKEPTELQKATMAAIARAGGFVTVATTKAEAIGFLEGLGLPPRVENAMG